MSTELGKYFLLHNNIPHNSSPNNLRINKQNMSGTYPTLLSNLTMLCGGYCHTEGLAQNTKPTLLVESGYLIATSVIQGVCSGTEVLL